MNSFKGICCWAKRGETPLVFFSLISVNMSFFDAFPRASVTYALHHLAGLKFMSLLLIWQTLQRWPKSYGDRCHQYLSRVNKWSLLPFCVAGLCSRSWHLGWATKTNSFLLLPQMLWINVNHNFHSFLYFPQLSKPFSSASPAGQPTFCTDVWCSWKSPYNSQEVTGRFLPLTEHILPFRQENRSLLRVSLTPCWVGSASCSHRDLNWKTISGSAVAGPVMTNMEAGLGRSRSDADTWPCCWRRWLISLCPNMRRIQ